MYVGCSLRFGLIVCLAPIDICWLNVRLFAFDCELRFWLFVMVVCSSCVCCDFVIMFTVVCVGLCWFLVSVVGGRLCCLYV